MIARICHGYTKPEHGDAYEAIQGAATCSDDRLGTRSFITIILWDSNAIRTVAGGDYETAVIPDERQKYLSP